MVAREDADTHTYAPELDTFRQLYTELHYFTCIIVDGVPTSPRRAGAMARAHRKSIRGKNIEDINIKGTGIENKQWKLSGETVQKGLSIGAGRHETLHRTFVVNFNVARRPRPTRP